MSSCPAPEFKIAVVRPLKFAVCPSSAEQSARPETHPVLLHQSPRSRHALAKSIGPPCVGGTGVNGGGVGQNTHPVGRPRPASQELAVKLVMHDASIVRTPLPQQAGSKHPPPVVGGGVGVHVIWSLAMLPATPFQLHPDDSNDDDCSDFNTRATQRAERSPSVAADAGHLPHHIELHHTVESAQRSKHEP